VCRTHLNLEKLTLAGRPAEYVDHRTNTQQYPGVAASGLLAIRNADLGRFTVDRLMSVRNRLGARVEVKVRVKHVA